jgi:predicted ester cyclase
MTNSVNSFKHLDELFAQVFGEQDKYFTENRMGVRIHDEVHHEYTTVPKKQSRMQRMRTQLNFNLRKFTNHRLVGNGIKVVNKRKFNPEV